jgi:phage shock protein PspC (stress-responsive transcriptional regulator)
MNKVFNINLGGIVFTIDDVAFEKLNSYINKLKSHFANTQGANDIIMDIEARMAELIREKLSDPTSIVNENIVVEVIAIMGEVNELDEENHSERSQEKEPKSATDFRDENKLRRDLNNKVLAGVCSGVANYFDVDPTLIRILFLIVFFAFGSGGLLYIVLWIVMKPIENADQVSSNYQNRKHLFRDADDKVLGGVCSGIANYVGLDSVWVRLFFALAFFGFGFGFLVYIILWIVVPKAITPSQKLQMKGDPIDVSSIEREVKNTFTNAKQNAPKVANEMKSFAGNASHAAVEIATVLIKAFGKIVAFILLLLGIVGIVFVASYYFGISKTVFAKEFISMCIDDVAVVNSINYGLLLIVSATLLSIIITAFRLLFNLKFKKGPIYSILSVISIIGFALLIYGGINYFKSVESKATFTQYISLGKKDTLYLTMLNKEFDNEKITINRYNKDFHFSISDEGVLQQTQQLKIKSSSNDSSFIEIRKTSHGYLKADALELANKLQYYIQSKDSLLVFDQGIFVAKNEKWKYPDIKMILNIPVGTILKLDEGVLEMLNRTNNNGVYYFGKTFLMTEQGLKCLDNTNASNDENDLDEDKDVNIDWSISDEDSNGTDIHIITKNKKVIIKDGRTTEIEEKRFGPFHIKIERHKKDDN